MTALALGLVFLACGIVVIWGGLALRFRTQDTIDRAAIVALIVAAVVVAVGLWPLVPR